MSTSPDKSARPSRLALWITGGALVVLGGAYLIGYAIAGDNTPRNAAVAGVAIGGLDAEAATEKLRSELGPRLQREMTVTAGQRTLHASAAELGLGIDYGATVAQAGAGRSWNPAHIVTVLTGGGDQQPVVTRDQQKLSAAIAGLAEKVDAAPVDAALTVKGLALVRSEAKPGVTLDQAQTADAVAGSFATNTTIAAVVTPSDPKVSTAEADRVAAAVESRSAWPPAPASTRSAGVPPLRAAVSRRREAVRP